MESVTDHAHELTMEAFRSHRGDLFETEVQLDRTKAPAIPYVVARGVVFTHPHRLNFPEGTRIKVGWEFNKTVLTVRRADLT